MTKLRFISFSLIFVLIPFFLAVPSFASTDDSFLVDVLPYGLGLNSVGSVSVDGNSFFGVGGSVEINLPEFSAVSYVDILLFLGNGWPPLLNFTVYGQALNVEYFGPYDNYVRIYGMVSAPLAQNKVITLGYSQSNSSYFLSISILSVRFSSINSPLQIVPGLQYATIEGDNYSWTGTSGYSRYVETSSIFSYQIQIDSWQGFDNLDVFTLVSSFSISSISVFIDGSVSVPFSISYLASAADFFNVPNLISFSLDLRNIPRSDDPIIIDINGSLNLGTATFQCFDIHGFVYPSVESPEVSWLGRIFNKLSSGITDIISSIATWGQNIVNAILGDPSNPPDNPVSDGSMENQAGQIEDYLDSFDQVERPDIGDIDTDISEIVPPNEFTSWTSWLSDIFDNYFFFYQITLSVIMILSGYVLFGKRG